MYIDIICIALARPVVIREERIQQKAEKAIHRHTA